MAFFPQSLNFRVDTLSISGVRGPSRCAHGWPSLSHNYDFLLPTLSADQGKLCSSLQACKSPFSGYHECSLEPSSLVELRVSLSVLRAVQTDLHWAIDGRKQSDGDGEGRGNSWWGHFCKIMRQRKKKGLQSTKRPSTFKDEATQRSWSVHSTCIDYMYTPCTRTRLRHPRSVQHHCATCASVVRDAVTAAQSQFLAMLRRLRINSLDT